MTNVVQVAIAILLQVESSGYPNPPAGDSGAAVGVLQIHPCMVYEINRLFGTKYTLEDRKNPDTSIEMARRFLSWTAYHRKITLPHKLAARWNRPADGRVSPEYRLRVLTCWCANKKARSG